MARVGHQLMLVGTDTPASDVVFGSMFVVIGVVFIVFRKRMASDFEWL